ncbi:hypothetical protein [Pseudonocardia xishanensis]|uniref:IclR-like helix-turn-helix domain-containing protein n=1 Tax=Pseudonocardia xishanensis TaxID=630995 RepID=A0ABP8RZ16_9PSEU
MTSSDDGRKVIEALRAHPRQAMTSTELAVRSGMTQEARFAQCLGDLREHRIVTTHDVLPADPHFPPIMAVALVPDGSDAVSVAEERARECAAVIQRQLLRSHRCQ